MLVLDDIQSTLQRNHVGKDKWYQLGLKLGLLQTTVDEIKAKHNNDPDRCLTDMLSRWLNRADSVDTKGGPTLNTLALALKDMGYTAAYDNIQQKVNNLI